MKQNNSKFLARCRGVVVGVSVIFMALSAHAQGAINKVSASVQAGSETLRIDFDQPLAIAPTGFATQSPARIALDLQGVVNASGKSAYEVNLGNLKSVNIVQGGDRSRIVLNLKSPST